MQAPEQITTARLVLRRPQPADATEIFARYASDPEVTRHLSWRRHCSVEDSTAFIKFSNRLWEQAHVGPYLIRLQASGALLGSTGLVLQEQNDADTGYVLARDAWRQGFATEATRAMIKLAMQLGIERLHALCHIDNIASARVLERCGFTALRIMHNLVEFPNFAPGVKCDVMAYILTLNEMPTQPDIINLKQR